MQQYITHNILVLDVGCLHNTHLKISEVLWDQAKGEGWKAPEGNDEGSLNCLEQTGNRN